MFKWIVIILLVAGIFTTPVKQGDSVQYGVNDETIQMTMVAAKRTMRSVLVITNNIVEVLILNLDATSVPQIENKDFNTKTF